MLKSLFNLHIEIAPEDPYQTGSGLKSQTISGIIMGQIDSPSWLCLSETWSLSFKEKYKQPVGFLQDKFELNLIWIESR